MRNKNLHLLESLDTPTTNIIAPVEFKYLLKLLII